MCARNGYDDAMEKDRDRQRQQESQEILRGVERDSGSFLTGSMSRAQDRLAAHFSARDAEGEDGAEKWGRRIGRALGLVAFAVLVLNLFTRWFF